MQVFACLVWPYFPTEVVTIWPRTKLRNKNVTLSHLHPALLFSRQPQPLTPMPLSPLSPSTTLCEVGKGRPLLPEEEKEIAASLYEGVN